MAQLWNLFNFLTIIGKMGLVKLRLFTKSDKSAHVQIDGEFEQLSTTLSNLPVSSSLQDSLFNENIIIIAFICAGVSLAASFYSVTVYSVSWLFCCHEVFFVHPERGLVQAAGWYHEWFLFNLCFDFCWAELLRSAEAGHCARPCSIAPFCSRVSSLTIGYCWGSYQHFGWFAG